MYYNKYMNIPSLGNKEAEFAAAFSDLATYKIDAKELFEAISRNDSGEGFDLIVQAIENINPEGNTLDGLLNLIHCLYDRATEFFDGLDGYRVCTTILRTLENELDHPTLPKMRMPSKRYQEFLRVNRNRSFAGKQRQLYHILQYSRDRIAAMQLNFVVAQESTENTSFGAIIESIPRLREFNEQHCRVVRSKTRVHTFGSFEDPRIAGAHDLGNTAGIIANLMRQNAEKYEQYDNEVRALVGQFLAISDDQLLGELQERTGLNIASAPELATIASCMHYNSELDAPLQWAVAPTEALTTLRNRVMTKLTSLLGYLPTTFGTDLRLEHILEKRVAKLILSMAMAKSQ